VDRESRAEKEDDEEKGGDENNRTRHAAVPCNV
jgi:hypothetical protein